MKITKKFVSYFLLLAFVCTSILTGCTEQKSDTNTTVETTTDIVEDSVVADTVVYGKIYTSNSKQEYVNAFAVKDGKYIYVGTEDGVKPYIKDGITKVVDYRDKGLVMAGATEGHGHYVAYGAIHHLNFVVPGTTVDEILKNVKEYVEKNQDKKVYYTFGWENEAMIAVKDKIDIKSKLDEICKDKVMFIGDNTGHNCFFNSKAAEVAGVTKDTEIVGGVFSKGENGELLGLASDMAMNYLIKHAVATEEIIKESDYEGLAKIMEETLHSYGYTYYQDGWSNFFDTQFMDALNGYDKSKGLSVVVSGAYKIDSYDDWNEELKKAVEWSKKYPTKHLKFNTIKLFADGEAVESKSGWLLDGYTDGTHGTQVWDAEQMNSIVKAANEAGISMHIHSQGDAATEQVVNAYINAESSQKGNIYNGICHGRNITEDSKKKMGEHHIYAAENINWRVFPKDDGELIEGILGTSLYKAGYPIKSLIDNGVNVSSSTDVPASSGAPTTVPGIIEVAVNDTREDFEVIQLDESERVSVETAMDIMTINGARQLQMESERGSIETGKYADFIFINKDIASCAKDKIHEGKVETVYFEGNEVYSLNASESKNANLKGKVLADYVIELPVVTEIDYEEGLSKNKKMFGKFGCSGIGKVLDNGDMVVGRSFDLYYSNNPAYVIRTSVDGFYKTVGLAYNTFDGHTFADVKENGVTYDELLTLLFFTVDVMNEKGLYIEADMRNEQPKETGISISTGTNPSATVSLSFPALVRYLGERCATVDEALELANTLNVYGMSNGKVNWGGGYLMADATGHYGVLELVDNKLIWTDGQNCQTNFYINNEYKDRAIIGGGIGRYELLRSEIGAVKTDDDMTKLMKKVRYLQMIDPYNCLFDPRSEVSGVGEEFKDFGGMLTIAMCADDQYKDKILEAMEAYGSKERAKSVEQLRDEGTQWLSVWQTTANCNKKSIKVIFFEDDALTFDFTV